MADLSRAWVALLALATLSACGSAQERPSLFSVARSLTSDVLSPEDSETGGADSARAALTRSVVEQFDQALILVEHPALDAVELMTLVETNDGTQTWRSRDDRGLLFTASGILLSSRGYGFDLMSSDPSETVAAIEQRQSRPVTRVMVYVRGGEEEVRSHLCTTRVIGSEVIELAEERHTVTRITETCEFTAGSYTNTFWVDQNGLAIRSDQWVSEELGTVRIERFG